MPKKQVAIVLGGGVSIGAYIAGALDELLHALSSASDRFEVDVIAGTSGGAITAALAAKALLHNGGHTELRNFWISTLDIHDLLTSNTDNYRHLSLLDGKRLSSLIHEAIVPSDITKSMGHAPCCAEEVTVAITLTNTTALPYALSTPGASSNVIFQHLNSEQETFYLNSMDPPAPTQWRRLARVALASFTIPFVTPLVPLQSQAGGLNDDRQYIRKPTFSGTRVFWYFDGGIFANLPLELASYHCNKHGRVPGDRIIIVIDAWQRTFSPLQADPPYPTLLEYLLGLHGALKRESSAHQMSNFSIGTTMHSWTVTAQSTTPILVTPRAEDGALSGVYLHTFSGLIDRQFREYDFRRGAADGRLAARESLDIAYSAQQTPDFYLPNEDTRLAHDLEEYFALRHIKSTQDPGRTVFEVLENSLDVRLSALLRKVDAPAVRSLFGIALRTGLLNPLIRESMHRSINEVWSQSS